MNKKVVRIIALALAILMALGVFSVALHVLLR